MQNNDNPQTQQENDETLKPSLQPKKHSKKLNYPIITSIIAFSVAIPISIYKIIKIYSNNCNPYSAAGLGCLDKSLDELIVFFVISTAV